MQRRDLNAPDAPAPAGAYTHVVEVSGVTRTAYISGQVGMDASGKVVDDFATQCRQVLSNLQAQLRAAGMSFDNIVKMTTILPNLADLAELRRIRSEIMGDRKPASTLIVAGLASPAWKLEIEVIACA
jgi:enamine deaminase RidA (YjgF/YER057c/UK114 family)